MSVVGQGTAGARVPSRVLAAEAVEFLLLLLPLAEGAEVAEGLEEESAEEGVGHGGGGGVGADVAGGAGLL
jgi:hypothetical protein